MSALGRHSFLARHAICSLKWQVKTKELKKELKVFLNGTEMREMKLVLGLKKIKVK